MSRKPSVMALDFDGVICDSIQECLRLSYAVFGEMEHGRPPDLSKVLTVAPPDDVSSRFEARRGFVRPASHYYLLWKWIFEYPERELSPASFENLAAGHSSQLETFRELFFSYRTVLRERYPDDWLRLNPPFEGVIELWPRLRRHPVYIVTTKDREAVTQFLRAHNLEVTQIFAAGEFVDKGHALAMIASLERCPPTQVLFVDDNASHLADAARAGVMLRWAAWGYDAEVPSDIPIVGSFAGLVDFTEDDATPPSVTQQRLP